MTSDESTADVLYEIMPVEDVHDQHCIFQNSRRILQVAHCASSKRLS